VKNSIGEVSGLGKVRQIDGELVVSDVILLEQTNSAAETEICDKAIGKAMFELKDVEGHLNFWWHSHVNMSCFWSGTDHAAIRQLGKHGWVIATVFNKNDEYKTAYYQKGDGFMPSLFINDLETSFGDTVTKEQESEWQKELNEKCKTKKYKLPSHVGPLGASNSGITQDWDDYVFNNPDVPLGGDYMPYPTTEQSKYLPAVPNEDRIEYIEWYEELYGELYKTESEFKQFYWDQQYNFKGGLA